MALTPEMEDRLRRTAAAIEHLPRLTDEEWMARIHTAPRFDLDEIAKGLLERGLVTRDWYDGFVTGRRLARSA